MANHHHESITISLDEDFVASLSQKHRRRFKSKLMQLLRKSFSLALLNWFFHFQIVTVVSENIPLKEDFLKRNCKISQGTHTVYFVWWVSPQISGFWVSPPKHVARGFFIPLYNYLVIFLASAATINGKPGINTKSFLTSNFTTLCFKRTNDILYIFIYNMYIYLVPFHLTLLLKFEVQALFWGVGWPSQKMTHPWLPDGEFRVARAVGSNAGEDARCLERGVETRYCSDRKHDLGPQNVAFWKGNTGLIISGTSRFMKYCDLGRMFFFVGFE